MIDGWLIYNNQAQFDARQLAVHARLKDIRGYNATKYAEPKHHPTDGRVALKIELREESPWYDDLLDELNPGDINNIEQLTSDWFTNDI